MILHQKVTEQWTFDKNRLGDVSSTMYEYDLYLRTDDQQVEFSPYLFGWSLPQKAQVYYWRHVCTAGSRGTYHFILNFLSHCMRCVFVRERNTVTLSLWSNWLPSNQLGWITRRELCTRIEYCMYLPWNNIARCPKLEGWKNNYLDLEDPKSAHYLAWIMGRV